jgi:N6-adenosine-specific RNA methylase IME4/ParB-like chromosome segregation protein Spo0J
MEYHPLANIFPLLEGAAFSALVADIKENGQREPIWVVMADAPTEHKCYGEGGCDIQAGDGVWHCTFCDHNPELIEYEILDGRNRYRACQLLGIEPITEIYDGDDPLELVLSLNLHRRHLSESQRGMVAAKVANIQLGDNQHGGSANLQTQPVSQAKAAEMLNVSPRTVAAAVKVRDEAAPELVRAVESGRVSVSAAADVATLPKAEQVVIVARGEREILEAAKQIRADKAEVKKAERIAEVTRQMQEIAVSTPRAPAGLFHVICIDPPWPYDDGNSASTYDPNGRRAANPYPEMTLEQIAALDIPAASDCVLWLWTTHKFMRHSFALLDGWGFEDKAVLTWAKDRMGLGRWLRSQSEFCIMAVKGSPVINLTNQTTILHGPLREHSRKPDEFYAMVESLCVGRKLDFFSREPRPGWEQFGNDQAKFA